MMWNIVDDSYQDMLIAFKYLNYHELWVASVVIPLCHIYILSSSRFIKLVLGLYWPNTGLVCHQPEAYQNQGDGQGEGRRG